MGQIGLAMKFARRQRRAFASSYRKLRNRAPVPGDAGNGVRLARFFEHLDLWAVDHGIFRFAYLNLHEVAPGVWRSAQPGPRDIRRLAKRGVRTIINLRGERDCGSYRLEQEACRRHGVQLVDFKMRSRGVPKKETIHQAAALFERVRYPVLIHCKSGADRAGMMGALYLLLREGRPVEDAMRQLSLKYGHFKQADTGVLDHFFASYRAANARQPIDFMTWVNEKYDPGEVAATFRARGITNFIVNRLLKRE